MPRESEDARVTEMLIQVSVYCTRRIPAHLRCTQCSKYVAPYRYLLPTMYLFMADIANPDLFVCGYRSIKISASIVLYMCVLYH